MWAFEFEGHVYRESDVTLEQWEEICDRAGTRTKDSKGAVVSVTPKPWPLVNPVMHPRDATSIFTVIVAAKSGKTLDEVKEIVGSWTLAEYMAAFKDDGKEDDLPTHFEDGLPKAEGDLGISGSSSVIESSVGPQT